MHNVTDFQLTKTASGEQIFETSQIRNSVHVSRRLLAPEAAIEVRTDAHMGSIAGKLANVIHVFDQPLQFKPGILWRALVPHPTGHQHPGIESGADDRVALYQAFDLFIA